MSRSIHETQKTLREAYPSKAALATLTPDDPIIERLSEKRQIKKAVKGSRKTSKMIVALNKKKRAQVAG